MSQRTTTVRFCLLTFLMTTQLLIYSKCRFRNVYIELHFAVNCIFVMPNIFTKHILHCYCFCRRRTSTIICTRTAQAASWRLWASSTMGACPHPSSSARHARSQRTQNLNIFSRDFWFFDISPSSIMNTVVIRINVVVVVIAELHIRHPRFTLFCCWPSIGGLTIQNNYTIIICMLPFFNIFLPFNTMLTISKRVLVGKVKFITSYITDDDDDDKTGSFWWKA